MDKARLRFRMVRGSIGVDRSIQVVNDGLVDMLGASAATIESRSLEIINFTHGSFFAATPTNSTKTGSLKLTTSGKGTTVEYECSARTYYKIILAIFGIISLGFGFIFFYIYAIRGPRKYIKNMMNTIAMPKYAETPPIEPAERYCAQCGTKIPPGAAFCSSCGASVT